ncbi:MAG: nitrite reductase [Desulfocapsaceae bacterium]|jgi:NAD(P)H-nitrite reductase large subunit|nr:nitrite reductase [Desulfocapsaceae bacterium]
MTSNQKTFTIIPGLNMGLFSPQELEQIAAIINKHDVPMTKITGAQRLALLGMDEEDQMKLKAELKPLTRPVAVNSFHYVQACPGSKWCKFGTSDAPALGARIEQISFAEPLPGKVKVAIAGCRMCCTEPYVRDIGIFASKKGWTLVFGGNAGSNPRIGDIVAEGLTDDQVIDLLQKCLAVYQQNAKNKSRTARFMERFGIDALKQAVLSA